MTSLVHGGRKVILKHQKRGIQVTVVNPRVRVYQNGLLLFFVVFLPLRTKRDLMLFKVCGVNAVIVLTVFSVNILVFNRRTLFYFAE